MKRNRKSRLEAIAKILRKSPSIQRMSRHCPIDVFPDENGFIFRIELRDQNGRLVDVFDIPANAEALVDHETTLHFVIVAFEVGLENEVWKAAGERLRKMKEGIEEMK